MLKRMQQSAVIQKIPNPNVSAMSSSQSFDVPAFQAMPSSVARISTGQIAQVPQNDINSIAYIQQSNTVKREVSKSSIIYVIVLFSDAQKLSI